MLTYKGTEIQSQHNLPLLSALLLNNHLLSIDFPLMDGKHLRSDGVHPNKKTTEILANFVIIKICSIFSHIKNNHVEKFVYKPLTKTENNEELHSRLYLEKKGYYENFCNNTKLLILK